MMGSHNVPHKKSWAWKKLEKPHKKLCLKIKSIPLWVKIRNVLRYVFCFHDECLKIWSCFPHSISEQLNFHNAFQGNQYYLTGVPIFRHLSDCPGFHEIHCEVSIALRTNAENKTISLNTRRGNQIHILKHCGISLKGVYSWFFSKKPFHFFHLFQSR